MSNNSGREIGDSLRTHLDGLANSVAYYHGRLLSLEIPEDLAHELVIDWHKGKVMSWVERQKGEVGTGRRNWD